MLSLDPEIVDQNKVRMRRRRKLIKYCLLPVIALLLISVFFLRTGVYNIIYSLSYQNQNFETPATISNMQLFGNMIESYIAYYNRGTAEINLAQYAEAEEDFRDSLRENPPKEILCRIYVNLSYSIEMQADKAAQRRLFDDALVLYNRAESILYENNCASKSDDVSGNDQRAEDSKDRISSKRRRAVEQMNNAEGEGGEGEGEDGELTPDQVKDLKNSKEVEGSIRSLQFSLGKGQGGSWSNSNKYRW